MQRRSRRNHTPAFKAKVALAAIKGDRTLSQARPIASGVPFRRLADAARPAGRRGVQGRPSSREDADAADGDRGALSPSAHDQARARPRGPSVPAARPDDRAAEPGVGDGLTYIPMARGFVYLAVVLDWFSRRVLSWRLSITMEAAFCIETLEDALARHGKPDIFNTDQGSQFTGVTFTGVLAGNGIAISMDGKGPGATTCSSSGCGAASNTKRFICAPTTACRTPAPRSAATSTSTSTHHNTHLSM
jgi:transposase InsO family protein